MEYTVKSYNMDDRKGLFHEAERYLKESGFKCVSENPFRIVSGSERGTVVLTRDIMNFKTRIDFGTADPTLLKELVGMVDKYSSK